MNRKLEASYRHCRRIARRSASSFYYSFLLLPKPKRMAMCALYAFLRRTDDLGDSRASAAERREALVSSARRRVSSTTRSCPRFPIPFARTGCRSRIWNQ
jgi:phytoene synthase